jgi:hypothetical protein
MYVICFYWQGDRWQSKDFKEKKSHVNLQNEHLSRIGTVSNDLASKYVNNLYAGVKAFANTDFEFICFTNEELDLSPSIKTRKFPLVTNSGVLPRLFMFSKESGLFGKQVLCLDLDVVIVGDLSNIMSYKGMFCTRAKFKPGYTHMIDGDIMSFKACKETEDIFWKPFINDVEAAEKKTLGRERYWVRNRIGDKSDLWDIVCPGNVVSYKWHVRRQNGIPKGASIVSCHGYPRPHQIKDKCIKRYWND